MPNLKKIKRLLLNVRFPREYFRDEATMLCAMIAYAVFLWVYVHIVLGGLVP